MDMNPDWYTPSVLVQIGLLAVGTLYTLFAWRQWKAIKHQAKLTERTLIADERAFVFADGLIQLFNPPDANGVYNWQLRPRYRNTGDTPTKDFTSHVHCEIRNDQLPPSYTFVYDATDIGTGMIGPHSEVQGGIAPRLPITPQDIIDVQQRRRFIYLWGRLEYFDVFENTSRHTTHFCWQVFVDGDPLAFRPDTLGRPPVPGTIAFSYIQHREGNYAD